MMGTRLEGEGESQILHHTHMVDMYAGVNKGSHIVHIMARLTQFLIVTR